ncbi:hypothetical protein DSO57_1007045 [Entomophthora muscae]|uniref:Uncharacterized protein n=1 Tax=Entomophthora muscae TaxID=34485 RepID=A0ACC2S9K6_9FUNG|nr:hypothetical protein DSO57_1007045 [Entomophthora muscae]
MLTRQTSFLSLASQVPKARFLHSSTPSTAEAVCSSELQNAPKFSPTTCQLVDKVRQQLRYFAVVQIKGRKYTVTENDTLILNRSDELKIGDALKLDRVSELGSADYSIIGSPFVSPEFYDIQATVIEHTRSPKFAVIKFKKRKGYRREHHYRNYYSLIKITKLEVKKLN